MTKPQFAIDDQTARDLDLFPSNRNVVAVFSIFNQTQWGGGERMLEKMFETPLTDVVALEERVEVLKYLEQMPEFMQIGREELKFIEIYLEHPDVPNGPEPVAMLKKTFSNLLKPDNDYYVHRRGCEATVRLLQKLDRFLSEFEKNSIPPGIIRYMERINGSVQDPIVRQALLARKIGIFASGRLDFYFRVKGKDRIREVLDTIYEIDALMAVAKVAKERGFVYPIYSSEENVIKMTGLYHPFVMDAVKNDANLSDEKNVYFLTGPNMAGKSTYMKAFGVAVYLAHLGFPVAAKRMEISVFNGLFSTINLPDNINLGYSHYFNEVLRIKHVAAEILRLKNVVVIFDELFRGTNVKDAYDASLAVISAIAGLHRNVFLISSHLLEVAEQLRTFNTIDFRCFGISMDGGEPRYTYELHSGISDERIGMYILNREKVVETILQAGK